MSRDTIGQSFRDTTPPDLRRSRDYTFKSLAAVITFGIAVGGVGIAVALKPDRDEFKDLEARVQGLTLQLERVNGELRLLATQISFTEGLRVLGQKLDQLAPKDEPEVDALGRPRRRR